MEGIVLSLDEVQDKLDNTRKRGGKEATIAEFWQSGELYLDLRTVEGNEKTQQDSLYNGYQSKIRDMRKAAEDKDETFWNLSVAKVGDGESATVVLINGDEAKRQKEAQAA